MHFMKIDKVYKVFFYINPRYTLYSTVTLCKVMSSNNSPIKCNICDNCLCFCKKNIDDIHEVKTLELIEKNIQEIMEREKHLRFLRQELEAIKREELSRLEFETNSSNT